MRVNGESVTATFWYGERARSVVARTRKDAEADALARWGRWDEVVYSTPQTIYNDLSGETRERRQRVGLRHSTVLLDRAVDYLAERWS